MKLLVLAALTAASAAQLRPRDTATSSTFSLTMLPSAAAKCNDGSDVGYYFDPSPSNSSLGIVFLEGGCVSPRPCCA